MSKLNLTLYECLQQVSLEKYHGKFTERGIFDVGGLLSLTMQDYPALGISSMADRQNLFYLIQTIKTMQVPSSQRGLLHNGTKNERLVPMEGTAVENKKDKKTGAKRPREATENSPVAIKIKSKTKDKSCASSARPSTMSRSTEYAAGFYNYGVPSYKPKQSPIKRVHSRSDLGLSRIQVCVRKRPLSKAELVGNEEDVVMVTDKNTVVLTAPKLAVDLTKYTQKYQFVFDEAFDEHYSNKDVFQRTAQPLIKTVFNRGKATCFAYGCTGSGKTFTMLGNEEVQGIYILAASEIFTKLHNETHGKGLGLWISFYEIYCGQLFDLLNGRAKLFAREDANHQVCIAGLTERHVHNVEELMEVIEYGGGVRSTGATGVNSDSSRSHAILQLDVKVICNEEHVGRFSFIDLAGCERAADVTDTDKQTRVEGAEINQSLLALKECIRALDLDSKHTPFRQSKLTQVLKDSFIGNCQTCMIATISPNKSCGENTLNTLRYADRVKELKKGIPVTSSSAPRPLTVPATMPEKDQLFCEDKNKALPGVAGIQVNSILEHPQGPLRKLRTGNIGTNKTLRLNTSSSNTILSPRGQDSTAVNNIPVGSPGSILGSNTKKGLKVPVHTSRPQTSPDVTTAKTQNLASRMQSKTRASKQKTSDNRTKSNGLTETLKEKCEEMPQEVQGTCEENDKSSDVLFVSASRLGSYNHLPEVVQRDNSTEELFKEHQNTQKPSYADKQLNESSPPSRNNRYGSGIKTRLSKLFSKGNTCMEEPKVVEPQTTRNELKAPHLIPTPSGSHKPTREVVHMFLDFGEQDKSHLSLSQEQLVASHHTQLAMVTGLCQEEMVLLKQINSGQKVDELFLDDNLINKDFRDYILQLNDILTRKAACIASLQEKLSKFPSQ